MDSQHVPVEGGCLCGAVRYRSEKSPLQGAYCHCTMCQRNYGGLFMAALQFTGADFRFTKGLPKYHRSSEFTRRGFCAECGSPLVFVYNSNPHVWVLVGSLDHPEGWPLTKGASWGQTVHLHVDNKIAWSAIDDGLPQLTGETTPFRDEAMVRSAGRDQNAADGTG